MARSLAVGISVVSCKMATFLPGIASYSCKSYLRYNALSSNFDFSSFRLVSFDPTVPVDETKYKVNHFTWIYL